MEINLWEIKAKTRISKPLGCVWVCPLLLSVILLLGFHENGFQKEAQVTPWKDVKFNNVCLSLKDNTLHPHLCRVPALLTSFQRQRGFLLLRQGYLKLLFSEKLKIRSWPPFLPPQALDPLPAPQEGSILCDFLRIFPDVCTAGWVC